MSLDQLTLRRGILIAFIGLLLSVACTAVGNASPINIEFHTPRIKLDPLNLVRHNFYGSGVVINKNAILTAFHNVEFPVKGAGTWFTGVKLHAYAPEKDLCVVKYPTEGHSFSRLAPEPPKVGDRVLLVARWGTYEGTWQVNPHYDDQMSIRFIGKRPRIGDSGGGVYLIESNPQFGVAAKLDGGLVGIFLGYSGWIDGPKGEFSRIASWQTLKDFGIPISGKSASVKPKLLPLPGTEDVKAPPEGRDSTKEEVQPETTAPKPEKEVNHGTRPTIGRSTETDKEHDHTGTSDREVARRRRSSLDDRGQRRRQGNEQSGRLKTGTAPEQRKGASLPPTAPNKGSGSNSMIEMLITAALGAAGIATTGGAGAAIYFGVKGAAALYRRRKRRKPDTKIRSLEEDLREVLGRKADSFPGPHIPGREVDEIGELLQLAELEGFDPLMGSAFGLFAQDEINRILSDGTTEEKQAIRKLRDAVTDRIHSAAPLVKGT